MKKKGVSYYFAHGLMHFVFICFCIIILIPFLLVVSISFSKEADIHTLGYQLIPAHFATTAYEFVLKTPQVILSAYKNSAFITVVGGVIGLLFTSMIGYVISRKDYRYRGVLTFYVFFTMLFSGGMVSFFIIVTQTLHLNDNLLAIILPGLVSAYYVILMRGFMTDIPLEIIESGKIDGASEVSIFFQIVLPLSKPALATLGLFIAFNYWNQWFNPMLFIDSDSKVPIQLLLVRMLNNIEMITTNPDAMAAMQSIGVNLSDMPSLTIRMANAVLAVAPMLIVFPFFQKYFVRGLTMGAVKG